MSDADAGCTASRAGFPALGGAVWRSDPGWRSRATGRGCCHRQHRGCLSPRYWWGDAAANVAGIGRLFLGPTGGLQFHRQLAGAPSAALAADARARCARDTRALRASMRGPALHCDAAGGRSGRRRHDARAPGRTAEALIRRAARSETPSKRGLYIRRTISPEPKRGPRLGPGTQRCVVDEEIK